MSNHLRLLTAVTSAFLIITFSGCTATWVPGKFTAGGTLPNPGADNDKATFTAHADSCDTPPTPPKLDVNYDGHDGVTLMSTSVMDAGKCAGPLAPGGLPSAAAHFARPWVGRAPGRSTERISCMNRKTRTGLAREKR